MLRNQSRVGTVPPATSTPDVGIMRVACETPNPAAGGLVLELKAKGQEKSDHELDKRLAVAQQLNGGRFVLKIHGDRPVCSRRFSRCAHVSPLYHLVSSADETRWG